MASQTRLLIKPARAALLMLLGTSAWAASAEDGADRPYAVLREGYAAADPARAAAAYAGDATFAELYPGIAPVLRSGQAEITAGFAELFRSLQLEPGKRGADLNFRFVRRGGAGDSGFYRLRIGTGRTVESYYGSFATRLGGGLFVTDTSGPGDRAGFEGAAGPVLFAPDDEELDPAYYDQFTGVYGEGACPLVVTRSVRRLFVLDECAGTWRGLTRQSGTDWTAGKTLIDATPVVSYRFASGQSLAVNAPGKPPADLPRIRAYRSEAVRFGTDGELGGTLYLPAVAKPGKWPAVAMIHGSGPQDRHGYASLIALMAQRLARQGVAVLAYDKRGVGLSDGDWASAGFAELASDAAAAMAKLRADPRIDPARVGLAGSSQAGWVAAQAVRSGSDPAFVLLVGAAGSALTVEEQNLYNTRVRMECARLPAADVALALRQQQAFFAARRDPARAAELAAVSALAQGRPALADWLFPATVERGTSPQWYEVLDPDFDPLPIWRSYRGQAIFLFGGSDDSTPATLAARRLASVPRAMVTLVPGMHHIGLKAETTCAGDIAPLGTLHPRFLATLDSWAAQLAGKD